MLTLMSLLLWGGSGTQVELAPTPTYIEFDPLGPLYLKQGDTAPIPFALRGAGGVPQELHGATVRWTVLQPDADEAMIDNELLEIIDEDDGAVTYTPNANELLPGRYRAQAIATWSNGRSRRFPTRGYAQVIIEASLA